MTWHTSDIDAVFQTLESTPNGLSKNAIAQKSTKFGPNQLVEKKKSPAWLLFLNQFKDFMILVLMAAAVISGIAGDITDAIIILVIVVLNAIVGFIQEYRAEKAMEALSKMAAPQAQVIRDGGEMTISATELVPGDVVLLESGNIAPADLRLFETHSLRIEESSLTGESAPVDKTNEVLSGDDLSPGDRVNMAYKSTLITNGRAKGIVVATGMDTELGKIAKMLDDGTSVTPLQKRMADFGRKLSVIIIIICVVLFGVGLLRGEEPLNMLLVSISLAVAAIPEALPALITIALSTGAKRLVKKNALIRKLPAVETLGSVTYICTDKTGTLTQNKMSVTEVVPYETDLSLSDELSVLECYMSLNHDVKLTEEGEWRGDPTEIAVVVYVNEKYTDDVYNKIQEEFPRVAELPFDSERKCMTTIHKYHDKFIAISKGAVEVITARLASTEQNKRIEEESDKLASDGIRVIAYAYRVLDSLPAEPLKADEIESQLSFAGLAGMIDPPREEAKGAIGECKSAGIHTVMITGDHKETAAAIARELEMLTADDLVLTGKDLNALSIPELEEKVEKVRVYARVSPEQKLNIVKALQNKGHFVAMTGDGVNDAPSLKTANIGIAMGINGTEVSKEAAQMILLDDNFATIVKAVREGRRIYDNIRKFVKYIMTCNSAEILTIFIAPLVGLPIPLLPIHILWINLVTDGLPGLALSVEREEKNIMEKPPRKTNESLFAHGTGYHIIWVGSLMAAITLGTQAWSIQTDNTHWQTMVFTVLSLSQLGHVFAIRSDEFIYKRGFFSNPFLLGAIVFTFILQLGIIYLPFANRLFKTQPLSLQELLLCILLSTMIFVAVEVEKWIKKIRKKS